MYIYIWVWVEIGLGTPIIGWLILNIDLNLWFLQVFNFDPYSWIILYICCRTPFGLRLLLPFWCRRGGVLVHGWCAEKENRGKGGSGKGKIGAGVGSCRSMDPVRISSGSRRDPVGHQFLHFWAPLLASRDPVGHQFSNFWHHVWTCREAATITQKRAKTLHKCYFLWIWLPPDIGPDWVPTGSRLGFFKKTPIFLNLSTYFWNFSTLPCTTPPVSPSGPPHQS